MTAAIDQHATCHHKTFRLGCDDFEALLDRAGSACELCLRRDVKLQIDHDRAADAAGRVRGLLCAKCNTHMSLVDHGKRESSETVDNYLAATLTTPGARNTPQRVVRISDADWDAAVAAARERNESLSEEIRRFLRRYVRRSK